MSTDQDTLPTTDDAPRDEGTHSSPVLAPTGDGNGKKVFVET